jgi:hypothetical protein
MINGKTRKIDVTPARFHRGASQWRQIREDILHA